MLIYTGDLKRLLGAAFLSFNYKLVLDFQKKTRVYTRVKNDFKLEIRF